MAWEVESTNEYDVWFLKQNAEGQASIQMLVELLKIYGPHLPRPYADTLKGSKLKNLKELRPKTAESIFRVAFIFNKKRNAVLLIGGNKKGKDEKLFYKNLIRQSEEIYLQYLGNEEET